MGTASHTSPCPAPLARRCCRATSSLKSCCIMRFTCATVMLPGSLRTTAGLWLDSGAMDLSATESILAPPVPVATAATGGRPCTSTRRCSSASAASASSGGAGAARASVSRM